MITKERLRALVSRAFWGISTEVSFVIILMTILLLLTTISFYWHLYT